MCLCIFNLCSYILEKEIATHSSILAWKIPWTEGSGGRQSMGPQSWTVCAHTEPHPSHCEH